MDTTQLIRPAGITGYPPLARGYIASTPVTFQEGVKVILPEGSTERSYGPCKWPAIHGTTKPAVGDECVVGFDERNMPTVLSWEGEQKPEELLTKNVAMAYRNAEQKIPTGALTTIKVDKAIKDPAGNFDLTNGYYVCPSAGYYHVDGSVACSVKANIGVNSAIRVNGTLKILGSLGYFNAETTPFAQVAGIVECAKGDHIELAVEQGAGEERKLTLAEWNNRLSVMLVGEGPEGKGGGGKTYLAKAAGGLELGGAETNEFAVKSEGIVEGMLAAAVIAKFHTYTAGEGLELSGSEFKVKALGIVAGMLAAESVTEAKLHAEAVSNTQVKAAAGIEESKLAIPEMVKLAGTQTITGEKTFQKLVVEKVLRFPAAKIALGAEENNNVASLGGAWIRFSSTVANANVSGFSEGLANGRFLFVTNGNPTSGTKTITLQNNSELSTEGNRMILTPGEEMVLQPGQSVILLYDSNNSRWRNFTNPVQKYKVEAPEEHTSATYEIEPSKTRNTMVLIRAVSKAATAAEYNVKVGATTVTQIIIPKGITELTDFSLTVPVPAGTKLTIEKVAGELEKSFTQITGVT